MGRFNLDAEGDGPLPGREAPAEVEGTPQRGMAEADSEPLIDPVTRERMQRTGAMVIKAAKVVGTRSVSTAQLGTSVAAQHVRKVFTCRPNPTVTRGLIVVVVILAVSGLGYLGWQHLPQPRDTSRATEPTRAAPSQVATAPLPAAARPEHPAAIDPADAIAAAMGSTRDAPPEPASSTTPSDLRERALPLKQDAAPTVDGNASGRTERDRQWKEASNEQVDVYFQQLNNQDREKEL